MTWLEIVEVAGALAVLVVPPIWALIVVRGDRRWAKRHELLKPDGSPFYATMAAVNGIGAKQGAMETLYLQTRERVDANQDRLTALEQSTISEQRRVTEVLINPMRELADEMHELRKEQEAHGRCLVKTEETLKGLGRSLDELRERINEKGAR